MILSACGWVATESATIPAPTFIVVNAINMPGVVIADLVPVLSGPGVEFQQVFTIPRGTSITVAGKSADDQWYMINLPGYSDSQGSLWIPVNLVAIVSPTETVTMTMTAVGLTLSPAPTETIAVVMSFPSLIAAIQRSRSCGAHAGCVVYIVQPGDNLFRLDLKTNTTFNQIMVANCLTSNQIAAGRTLYLPFIPLADTLTPTLTPTDTPTASPTPTPILQITTVFANQAWQDTGIAVNPGDVLTIQYISGLWRWTGDRADYDGNGDPAANGTYLDICTTN